MRNKVRNVKVIRPNRVELCPENDAQVGLLKVSHLKNYGLHNTFLRSGISSLETRNRQKRLCHTEA